MSQNQTDIAKMVSRYRTLRTRKDKIDKELSELKDQIIEYLEESGIQASETLQVGKASIKFVESSRTTLNRSAIVEVFGENLSQFETVTPFTRLYVK